ncbi:hypothetical protein [Methylobacterium mesophilicum]|uniref:hypothetical protein n=1 Tax=Methylobacterium mesophilicum TaxID=39956 RepID=UPI002F355F88
MTRLLRHTVSCRLIVVAFSALMIPPAAQAAGSLEAALRAVPDSALATSDPMPIVFMDVQALSKAAGGALSDAGLRRMAFHQNIRPLNALSYGGAQSWTETAGIPFEDISYFAAFGQPPARVSDWGLATKAAADDLIGKLRDRNFRPVSTAPRILANGEPRAVNLKGRQPTSPWSGPMGETSAVLAIDRVVAQASAAEDLEKRVGVGRSAADHAAVATSLAGLAAADDRDPGAILQAAVVTPLMGVTLDDPASVLSATDRAAMRKAIDDQRERGRDGIPAYEGGIVADYQGRAGPALLVSLAYPDCPTAGRAVTALKARWQAGMPSAASADGRTVESPQRGCAAVLRVNQAPGAGTPFAAFLESYMRRGFNVLQIGMPR